ncbi:MAG: phosphoribosylformylglycinamidine synthase, partial [Chloroflexi bacterium]|nr:phosphoribosylformylglycinamidine synthase [Chloroflexota bacterium]
MGQSYRIEVQRPHTKPLADERVLLNTIQQLDIWSISACRVEKLYFVEGSLNDAQLQRLADTLLADPVTEVANVVAADEAFFSSQADHLVEVTRLPGVTDPAADSLIWAARHIGIELDRAATGQRYLINGMPNPDELITCASKVFANPVIERFHIDGVISPPFTPAREPDNTVEIIPIREADDARLAEINAERRLALDDEELWAIRAYYQQEGRDPSDAELETLAQTWSEHCVHKTFKATIQYSGPLPGEAGDAAPSEQTIYGLLDSYIRAATERINKRWVRSAFVDNAGIMEFDDRWDLAFKVETHNHPSALEPFGGANTGIGGVVRDILGVSARPIANTDILCFGPTDMPYSDLPAGVLHPRRVESGVVHGIEDYGNKMGIPTVNGAVLYDRGYTANPLVFCGSLGILPRNGHPNDVRPGDLVVVLGGRTGRDGLRGATFSSMEIDQSTHEIAGSSVQIGNPIVEKQIQEVVLQARYELLYHAITDCGAGGLSSAIGEMGAKLGVRVQLDTVPTKYPGLRPWEIWLSEAQERMVMAVAPEAWARLQVIATLHQVEVSHIGQFERSGRLQLFYADQQVADLGMAFLHDGRPTRTLEANWSMPEQPSTVQQPDQEDLGETLLKLLAHPNIRSKEDIVRRYDHEVQGGTVIKPFVGVYEHGPSDAAVLLPLDTIKPQSVDLPTATMIAADQAPRKGVALGVGICPQYGQVDPYA